jgi:RimJ/RimL family protein N-acetyltransferase
MWFKQVTCDNCYSPLQLLSVQNKFVVLPILRSKIIECDMTFSKYIPFAEEYSFQFADFNKLRPSGNLHIYKIQEDSLQLEQQTYFCSKKCAFEYSLSHENILLFYDEELSKVRAIAPCMIDINRILGGGLYRSLNVVWPYEWIINFPKEDLSAYNFNDNSLDIDTKRLKVRRIIKDDLESLSDLMLSDNFFKHFDYSLSVEKHKSRVKNISFKKSLEMYNTNYKRRTHLNLSIMLPKLNQFIGFINIGAKDDEWQLEFALVEKFQGKGYLKEALVHVLAWCKTNGLDEIRALVELDNHKCISLLKNFNCRVVQRPIYNLSGETRLAYWYLIKTAN